MNYGTPLRTSVDRADAERRYSRRSLALVAFLAALLVCMILTVALVMAG